MQGLIDQTEKRRKKQIAYNTLHNIVPQTVIKEKRQTVSEIVSSRPRRKKSALPDFNCDTFADGENERIDLEKLQLNESDAAALIAELTGEMLEAAEALEFERAADLRDQIRALTGSEKGKASKKRSKK